MYNFANHGHDETWHYFSYYAVTKLCLWSTKVRAKHVALKISSGSVLTKVGTQLWTVVTGLTALLHSCNSTTIPSTHGHEHLYVNWTWCNTCCGNVNMDMKRMKRRNVRICLTWLLIFDQQIGFQKNSHPTPATMSFSSLFLYGIALCSCVLNPFHIGQKAHYHLLTSGFCPL